MNQLKPSEKLAIIGKGPTQEQGIEFARRHNCECWGINNITRYSQLTCVWELHDWTLENNLSNAIHLDMIPVMMKRAHPAVETAIEYPIDRMLEVYHPHGLLYANNTLAYMLMMACAMRRRFRHIFLAGVDYKCPDRCELEFERACTEYWIGVARGLGLTVEIAPGGNLFTFPMYKAGILYGYTPGYAQAIQGQKQAALHTAAEMLMEGLGLPNRKTHDHAHFFAYMTECVRNYQRDDT